MRPLRTAYEAAESWLWTFKWCLPIMGYRGLDSLEVVRSVQSLEKGPGINECETVTYDDLEKCATAASQLLTDLPELKFVNHKLMDVDEWMTNVRLKCGQGDIVGASKGGRRRSQTSFISRRKQNTQSPEGQETAPDVTILSIVGDSERYHGIVEPALNHPAVILNQSASDLLLALLEKGRSLGISVQVRLDDHWSLNLNE